MNGNPYVTYIESRYLEKCKKSGNSDEIVTDWKSKKNYYRRMTQTTMYEFMNYSMHEESHSINILESIEMLLGRKRIDKMSRSDLWLLLNVAYAHDIGMVLEYQELEKLWSNPKFQKYIEETKKSLDKDDARAAGFYDLLDTLLKQYCKGVDTTPKKELEFEFKLHDAWPLEFRRAVTILMTNFVRKEHGVLSETFFMLPDGYHDYIICDRMRKLIGRIAACHTEGQDSVDELPCYCKGFGTDSMHPRFIATLLRLGDLLDLDNNRFDVFSIRHFGPLPAISVANYKKHKSIVHFHISPHTIEVTAKSDDFQVCKLNQQWFQYLREDIEYLITHWNKIAPKQLRGCLLGVPQLEIWHGDNRFENNSNRDFVLEKKKLLDLFMGHNLYKSRLDFIREYIQNAFDASKLQLFYEIRSEEKTENDDYTYTKRAMYLKDEYIDLKNLKPFDLTRMAFDSFSIVVRLKYDREDKKNFILQIIDKGIGIDKEGIEAITNVGVGWKKRTNHKAALDEMRKWMKPTGGFGIGMQSAFLVTDEVKLYTKSAFENGFRITLSKQSQNNNVIVETDGKNLYQGTKVEFKIPFDTFDEPAISGLCTLKEKDYFTQKGRMRIVFNILENYISRTFPSSLFPIKLLMEPESQNDRQEQKVFISAKIFQEINEDKKSRYILPQYYGYGQEYEKGKAELYTEFFDFVKTFHKTPDKVYANFEESVLRIWDDDSQVFYYFSMPKDYSQINVYANYRNVLVSEDTREIKLVNTKHAEFLDNCYDVMGVSVEDCLAVSRDHFLDTEEVKKIILTDKFAKCYMHLLLSYFRKDSTSLGLMVLYAILVEDDQKLIRKIFDEYKDVVTGDMVEVWTISKRENEEFERQNMELRQVLNDSNGYIWFVERTDLEKTEEDKKEREVPYIAKVHKPEDKFEFIVRGNQQENTIKYNIEQVRIIKDKKICAILGQYGKLNKDVSIKFQRITPGEFLNISPFEFYEEGRTLLKTMLRWDEQEQVAEKGMNAKRFARAYRDNDLETDILPLLVNRRPFEKEDGESYLISPYTVKLKMQLEKIKEATKEEKIKSVENWLQSDLAYKEICQWVYLHQREKGQYSLDDIEQAYKKFVTSDIKNDDI